MLAWRPDLRNLVFQAERVEGNLASIGTERVPGESYIFLSTLRGSFLSIWAASLSSILTFLPELLDMF